MSHPVLKANDFGPSTHIKWLKPKLTKKGSKSIGILNNLNKPLLLQVPKGTMTYGASIFTGQNDGGNSSSNADGPGGYTLSFQFPSKTDPTASPELQVLREKLEEMDKIVLQEIFNNSMEWLGKTYKDIDYLTELYQPILRYPKIKGTQVPDLSRDPTLKVKLPIVEGVPQYSLFDAKTKKMVDLSSLSPEESIPKGARMMAVIQCNSIWVLNGKFGVTWKLFQGCVSPYERLDRTQCLLVMDDDASAAAAPLPPAPPSTTYVMDDGVTNNGDEEEDVGEDGVEEEATTPTTEEASEEAAAPATPQQPPAKKRAVKKSS
jgi:hypothetical protein